MAGLNSSEKLKTRLRVAELSKKKSALLAAENPVQRKRNPAGMRESPALRHLPSAETARTVPTAAARHPCPRPRKTALPKRKDKKKGS